MKLTGLWGKRKELYNVSVVGLILNAILHLRGVMTSFYRHFQVLTRGHVDPHSPLFSIYLRETIAVIRKHE